MPGEGTFISRIIFFGFIVLVYSDALAPIAVEILFLFLDFPRQVRDIFKKKIATESGKQLPN